MKTFNQAPLPFQGQKRRFLKHFKEALKKFPNDSTYVDLFGGSGLLSHTVKNMYPNAKVIYNDFDNYVERLKNINKTNQLLADIRGVLNNYPKDKKLTPELKKLILDKLKQEKGFVDYITLSSSLCFSMKYQTSILGFEKNSMYNVVKQSNYNATGYLQGVERVQEDYKNLFETYKNNKNVVFLIDPPYLSTDSSTYKCDGYWKLSDYLDVLKCLMGNKYFYFTSNKSYLIELCEWLSNNLNAKNPFENAVEIKINTSVNFNSKYTDIMLFKY